jgi:hypothetical protein
VERHLASHILGVTEVDAAAVERAHALRREFLSQRLNAADQHVRPYYEECLAQVDEAKRVLASLAPPLPAPPPRMPVSPPPRPVTRPPRPEPPRVALPPPSRRSAARVAPAPAAWLPRVRRRWLWVSLCWIPWVALHVLCVFIWLPGSRGSYWWWGLLSGLALGAASALLLLAARRLGGDPSPWPWAWVLAPALGLALAGASVDNLGLSDWSLPGTFWLVMVAGLTSTAGQARALHRMRLSWRRWFVANTSAWFAAWFAMMLDKNFPVTAFFLLDFMVCPPLAALFGGWSFAWVVARVRAPEA